MENLTKAILEVMREVKGIDKSMTVGTGNSSYKAVSDKDVKIKIGESMRKNGLCIMPIEVNASHEVELYDQTYNGNTSKKKMVFASVTTRYRLMHLSGESMEIAGYGHGVDTQDKAAGKATTYALKYALLYTFLVPTGHIDDSDSTHSEDYASSKPPLSRDNYQKTASFIENGGDWKDVESKYYVSQKVKDEIDALIG